MKKAFIKYDGIMRLATIILTVLLLNSCKTNEKEFAKKMPKSSDDWENIAVISGTDKQAQKSISRVFKDNGIECLLEGSVVYGVLVPRSQAKKARELLKALNELKDIWKQFPEESNPKQ